MELSKRAVGLVTLATLIFQNTILVLLMRYSLIVDVKERYVSTTVVLLSEVVKCLVSTIVVALEHRSEGLKKTWNILIMGEMWRVLIPAALYTIQNVLGYIVVSNLDITTVQISHQLKIISTAIFSVIFLGRRLSLMKWISLVLLTLGIVIVSLPPFLSLSDILHKMEYITGVTQYSLRRPDQYSRHTSPLQGHSTRLFKRLIDADDVSNHVHYKIGIVAALASCICAGLAAVYFELILKLGSASIWVRNFQLSLISTFCVAIFGVGLMDSQQIMTRGFFVGYDSIVWLLVFMQAIGGLIVSFAIVYTDNITKNFATSISVIITILLGIWIFHSPAGITLVIGTAVSLFATWLYTISDDKNRRISPMSIESYNLVEFDQRHPNHKIDV